MKAVRQRHMQYVTLPCWLMILANVARQHVDVGRQRFCYIVRNSTYIASLIHMSSFITCIFV